MAQRPYQASLICSLNDSELYVWTRADFQRAFRPGESWTAAVSHAQAKEVEYVDRCRSTLDVHKKVEVKNNAEARKGKTGPGADWDLIELRKKISAPTRNNGQTRSLERSSSPHSKSK